jgi:hypothetical protein
MSDETVCKRKIHILMLGMTDMIADLIDQAINHQSDLRFLGQVGRWIDVTAELATRTDVLVMEVETFDPMPEPCIRLICTFPHLKILMLTTHSNSAVACWLGLHRHPLCIESTQMLIDSIRQLPVLDPLQRL